ncbi:MAG: restriction endonuclease subunit S [Betaproteobacteria bacterium]|nr:restriction endonuclease subunit S [Betaproteobacteria bacterium]
MRRGKAGLRFDPSFHLPNPDLPGQSGFPIKFDVKSLAALCSNIIQPNEFTREYTDDSPDSVALIRAANVRDCELDLSDLVFVAKSKLESKSFDASYIKEGDILITRTGAKAGETCVVPQLKRDYIVSSHSIRVVPRKEAVESRYLEMFLISRWGKAQVNRLFTGAAQPQLQLSTVSQLQISIPPRAKQIDLIAAMDAARVERWAKLAEADALLAGLDGYVLEALGLTPPPKDERKVYAVSKSSLGSQSRLNADYFHPERILALRALEHPMQHLDCPRLEEVVGFIRDQIKTPGPNYLSLANVQSHTGELVPTDENVTGACSTFQRGDVLFARLRPYLNKVHTAEADGCCSPEFHVLRIKDADALSPDYLAAILRSSLTLAQTRHMMTGNTHPRLTNEDVVNLVIPVPKPAIQEMIATEARRRREEARRLRAEAEAGWQAAKRWFEEQLLGPVQP